MHASYFVHSSDFIFLKKEFIFDSDQKLWFQSLDPDTILFIPTELASRHKA